MTPKCVDHLVLEVQDVDRSLAFYGDLLGLQPERLDAFRAGHAPFVSVRAGHTLIDLFPTAHPGPGPHHFCLEFDEPIDVIASAIRQAGLTADPPERRFGAKGSGTSFYVRDPDGHQVELRSYRG